MVKYHDKREQKVCVDSYFLRRVQHFGHNYSSQLEQEAKSMSPVENTNQNEQIGNVHSPKFSKPTPSDVLQQGYTSLYSTKYLEVILYFKANICVFYTKVHF